MPGGIFINFQREDARWPAARLAEALSFAIGDDHVVPDLPPGTDSVETNRQLARCAVMLVLIGPRWLNSHNSQGLRRVDDMDDPVRQQIVAGLRGGIHLIPVLLDGTPMPSRFDLPPPLKPLADLPSVALSGARFDVELQTLLAAIGREPRMSRDAAYAPLVGAVRHDRHWGVLAVALVAAVAAVVIGADRAGDRHSLADRLIKQIPFTTGSGAVPVKQRGDHGAGQHQELDRRLSAVG